MCNGSCATAAMCGRMCWAYRCAPLAWRKFVVGVHTSKQATSGSAAMIQGVGNKGGLKKRHLLVVVLLVLGVVQLRFLWAHDRTRAGKQEAVPAVMKAMKNKEGRDVVRITSPLLGKAPTESVEVHFGRKPAQVVSHRRSTIECTVPPSDYPGIGYDVNVSVVVHADVAGKRTLLANNLWWTYPATVPPTEVANTGVFWIDDTSELHQNVLRLFSDRLGSAWRIHLLITEDLVETLLNMSSLISEEVASGRFLITPKQKGTRRLYARTCTYPEYWEMLQGDRLLVFQSDSVPCSGSNHEIDEFFDYDYVGAPWVYNDHEGGNGGLSLRNRTAVISMLKHNIEEIQRQASQDNFDWEDDLYRLSKLPPRSTHFLAHRRTQNKR